MKTASLFSGDAPRVRAVPAGLDFLGLLAERLLTELSDPADPFRLADCLVLVPNRRSAKALIDTFAKRKAACLLPAIRPLGDLDDAPEVWGGGVDLELPPAIDPLRRRLELAYLVRARDKQAGGADDPLRALACADDLGRLLDSAAAGAGSVDWSSLQGLIAEARFAEHWERAVSFLQIITNYWPQRLALDGLCDPAERRNRVLEALAARWRAAPPQTPVLIAGSTGSVAATRALMAVASQLPQGCVLLPGLDAELDDAAWEAIDPQHPQHALKLTLETLGVNRRDTPWLAGAVDSPRGAARRALIREALVPADATTDWLTRLKQAGGARLAKEGAAGLSLLECASAEEEASAIAMLMRETLEHPGRTAALVTPDAGLAHRVEVKLGRWGVQLSGSEGERLAESQRGVLFAILLDLARDGADPVALAGLITHPLATFDLAPQQREHAVARWLKALRGPRRHDQFDSLAAEMAGEALTAPLAGLVASLRVADAAATTLAALAEGLAEALERAAGPQAFGERDGEALADLLRTLATDGAALGDCSVAQATKAIAALARTKSCPPKASGEPRLAILGPLEGRLQARDLVILGGLNEGTWPAPPPEDGFLNRAMREALGLPPPETRLGLAAHDFAQLACGGEVVLTRAKRVDGSPTVASRWLWRLITFLKGAGIDTLAPAPERDPRRWAEALDGAARFAPAPPPKPRPPPSARPKEISFTDVETLIRDPYAIYAKRVLGLRPLDMVGLAPGPRERGTAIHEAIERLGPGASPEALLDAIVEALGRRGFPATRRQEERARLARAAERFVGWLQERQDARTFLEVDGELDIGGVRLFGRADRIDVFQDRAEVVDYKTGAPPTAKQVESGLTPQLTLEAAILARGGFKPAPKAHPTGLVYWRFSGSDPRATPLSFEEHSVADLAEETLAELTALLAKYARPEQPYLCKPRPQFLREYTDYDQLARRREWSEGEG